MSNLPARPWIFERSSGRIRDAKGECIAQVFAEDDHQIDVLVSRFCGEEIGQLRSRIATLEFELKAKTNECEIADGEIERLKVITTPAPRQDDADRIREAAEDVVNRWAGGEPLDEEMLGLMWAIGWEAAP